MDTVNFLFYASASAALYLIARNCEHQFFVIISHSSNCMKNKSKILKSLKVASRDFKRC